MIEIRFTLNLSAQEMMKYYRGTTKVVYVKGHHGKSLQFPAVVLQKFITRDGVYGKFLMRVDDNYKFIDIQKIE